MGSEEARLPARRDQHVVAAGGHAGARLHALGHLVAQRRHAGHLGIAGMAAPRAVIHRGQDRRVGADVMLADGQLDHRLARLGQGAGAIEHVPPVRAAAGEMGDAVRKLHGSPPVSTRRQGQGGRGLSIRRSPRAPRRFFWPQILRGRPKAEGSAPRTGPTPRPAFCLFLSPRACYSQRHEPDVPHHLLLHYSPLIAPAGRFLSFPSPRQVAKPAPSAAPLRSTS